jgi:hypothetical protein
MTGLMGRTAYSGDAALTGGPHIVPALDIVLPVLAAPHPGTRP